MISEQRYWNPVLETLPREKLRALQLKKFKSIFEWAYENSRFHRSLYDKAGITLRISGNLRISAMCPKWKNP